MKEKQVTQEESWLKTAITDGRKELKKLQDTDMHEILVKYVSDKIQSSVKKWFDQLEIARQPLNDSSFSNYLISNTAAYHTTISTESLISEYGMLHHSYDDLVDEIGKYKRISDELADVTREPEAEIAVIVDPESALYINDNLGCYEHSLAGDVFTELLTLCNRLGTPYKVYSLNDIPHLADFGKIKFAILPGLFEVTPEKEELLRKFVLKDNRTILWTYGAALNDRIRKTPENMLKLTGIPCGTEETMQATMNGWTSLFSPSTPALSVHQLRKYAQDAGVHFFTGMECPVWAAEDLLMIHTTESGKRTIRLRCPAKLRTLLGNPVAEQVCTEFEYEFSGPETILIQLNNQA